MGLLAVFLLLLVAFGQLSRLQASDLPDEEFKKWQIESQILRSLEKNSDRFGSALICYQKDGLLGFVQHPSDSHETYEIASIVKLLIQDFLLEGRYNHEIRSQSVEFSNSKNYLHRVTYGELMSHRSGIVQNREGRFFFHEPGLYFHYSNLNFKILIGDFESRTGKDFVSEFRSYISKIGILEPEIDAQKLREGKGGVRCHADDILIIFSHLTENIDKSVNFLCWYDSAKDSEGYQLAYYPAQAEKGYGEVFLDQKNEEGFLFLSNYNDLPVITFSEKISIFSKPVESDPFQVFQNARSWKFNNENEYDIAGEYKSTDPTTGSTEFKTITYNFEDRFPILTPDDKKLKPTNNPNIFFADPFEKTDFDSQYYGYLNPNNSNYIFIQRTAKGPAFLYQNKLFIRSGDYLSE